MTTTETTTAIDTTTWAARAIKDRTTFLSRLDTLIERVCATDPSAHQHLDPLRDKVASMGEAFWRRTAGNVPIAGVASNIGFKHLYSALSSAQYNHKVK